MNSIQSYVIRFLLKQSNIWNKPLSEIRKTMEDIKTNDLPNSITIGQEEVNGVACKVFHNNGSQSDKVIIYFHGGGFCLGIYNPNTEFVAKIAKQTGNSVYMPIYRLAPEHPYPAALEDAVAVINGLMARGHRIEQTMVIGDSSGCALALSALHALNQSGKHTPKALAFMTPVFDFVGKGESFITRAGKDPFKLIDPLGIAKLYYQSNNAASPFISPLYSDFERLPPVLIHAADYDVFLSDSIRFKESAEAIGRVVELKVWKKMWHVFHMQAGVVPESNKALDELCSYIKFHMSDVRL